MLQGRRHERCLGHEDGCPGLRPSHAQDQMAFCRICQWSWELGSSRSGNISFLIRICPHFVFERIRIVFAHDVDSTRDAIFLHSFIVILKYISGLFAEAMRRSLSQALLQVLEAL
jgi:hypothetical protein